jgi:hypothetical protein
MTVVPLESPHTYETHTPWSLADWQRYLSHNELYLLDRLAKRLPEGAHIVNIGAGAGTSALAFLSARSDVRVTTIDVQLEINLYGGLENEMGILRAAGLLDPARYTPIHGDSVAVGRAWQGGPVHLVFVDGGHEYEECRGDLEAWLPHLAPGGLLAVHDYRKLEVFQAQHLDVTVTDELVTTLIKPYPGVDQAVGDLLASRRAVEVETVDTLIIMRQVSE